VQTGAQVDERGGNQLVFELRVSPRPVPPQSDRL
jgi:hypothetical protein